MPLTGLTSPFGEVDRQGNEIVPCHRPEHHLRESREPARSGFPIRCRLAIPSGSTPRMMPAQRKRCLLPTICSRLVVTCTPHDTLVPSSGAFAPPTAALPPRFLQVGSPAFHVASNAPAPASPCGHRQPWMAVVWCPNDQPKSFHRPSSGIPGVPGKALAGLVGTT